MDQINEHLDLHQPDKNFLKHHFCLKNYLTLFMVKCCILTHITADHQGAVEMFWLHFWRALSSKLTLTKCLKLLGTMMVFCGKKKSMSSERELRFFSSSTPPSHSRSSPACSYAAVWCKISSCSFGVGPVDGASR